MEGLTETGLAEDDPDTTKIVNHKATTDMRKAEDRAAGLSDEDRPSDWLPKKSSCTFI